MKALDAIYRWTRTPWDPLVRVLVAFAMALPVHALPYTWACVLLVSAVAVQLVFASLVWIAINDHYQRDE